ncbi:MAG TPA: SDR family NAD(P)-dependent oxidoreductase [Actinomycetes bacterium]|nr:SDR family NAD(P)-dependent oxidoreductase [Actinomycetes bacterium]
MRDGLGSVQSVLVLGGGSELALATVRALVRERARTVVLAGRRPSALRAAADELRRLGATTVDTVAFDADDLPGHEAFVTDVFERHGHIDLVLVAFGLLGRDLDPLADPKAAVGLLHTNFLGAASVILPVARRLVEQGQGTLVVLSSVAGERVRKSNLVYGASKAALDAFCQGLGDRLAGTGVGVLVVRPGFVPTRMTAGMPPAPLATTPEAVAEAILGGVRRGAHTVWVPPALRVVMSGLRHLPRAAFRRIER